MLNLDSTNSIGHKASEDKFDRLFQGSGNNEDEGSDTSRIMSEEKNAHSNKLDTWGDSGTSGDDSDDMVEFNKKLSTLETNVMRNFSSRKNANI